MKKHSFFNITIIFLLTFTNYPAYASSEDPGSGMFMIRQDGNTPYQPALLQKSDASVQVSGPIAKVTLKQQFFNQSDHYVEGKYLFPLPEDAAVNAMRMQVAGRVIHGKIHEKQKAKQIYEKAKSQGKKAGLVKQNRPNLFTTQLANIPPQEAITVEITYIEKIDYAHNVFSLHVPMTFTPRYALDEQVASDVASIFTAKKNELGNVASVKVAISGAAYLRNIRSHHHEITSQPKRDQLLITTKEKHIAMDRDFTLSWQMGKDDLQHLFFFREEVDGEEYGLVMITPPLEPKPKKSLKREVIYIIDTSGSMGGDSIRQAKSSLTKAVQQLEANDLFNIIEFNSVHHKLFSESRQASAEVKKEALKFVSQLNAEGGTEMAPALQEALTMEEHSDYLRQIVFMTDGAVSNENMLLGMIHQLLGDSRLFMVGIGSAPNRYFMKKAADFGRGGHVVIVKNSEVDEKMQQLFQQLSHPVSKDMTLTFNRGVVADSYPQRVPDLYAGEPLFLAMKFNKLPKYLTIKGKGKSDWKTTLSVSSLQKHQGIASIWAREKIESLLDQQRRSRAKDSLRQGILETALSHQLLSPYTSFVAVEEIISRPKDQALKKDHVANRLPAGMGVNRSTSYPSTALGVLGYLFWGSISLLTAFILMIRRRFC